MQLRSYQLRAIGELRVAYARGYRAPCLVLPTGGGKTHVAAEVIRSATARGNRTLFLAHRTELIDQTVNKLAHAGVHDVRIIRAGSDTGSRLAPVAVASIPTLTRWLDNLPPADLVVFDESHHIVSETWASLAGRYASARLLGLTATPQRGDGKALDDIFDAIVVGATVGELTELGHLVPCQVWAPSERLNPGELALTPLEAYQRFAGDRPTIVFAATLEHAEQAHKEFERAGIRAGVVHGKLSAAARVETLTRYRDDVLINVFCLTEGWDHPPMACCILARNPQHASTYLQMVGRVLRPAPGKTHATLVDLTGCVHAHGTPDATRTYTLDGAGITRDARTPIRQCVFCAFCWSGSGNVCTACGETQPLKSTELPSSIGVGVSMVGAPVAPRPMRPKILVSKYPSKCRACALPIRTGDRIAWVAGEKAQHEGCYLNELLQGVQ